MHIDMALATSYKPVLVCIVKVCVLMVFHYASTPFLFIEERYALILATLYVDKWLSYEYILNTNSCVAMIAASLLVHELRGIGLQSRIHAGFVHTVALSMLVASNTIVLLVGENHSLVAWSSSNKPVSSNSTDDVDKKHRQQPSKYSAHHNSSIFTIGALLCVVFNSVILVVLATCAMPVNTHDPLLNNIRVWSFMVLSLVWLYTVNYRELRYSIIAPFTPCVLRFSSVLFLTPTPVAIGGVALLGSCLAVTHILIQKQYRELILPCIFTQDHIHHATNPTDRAIVVGREPQPKSVVSYRTPVILPEKAESISVTTAGTATAFGSTAFGLGNSSAFGVSVSGDVDDRSRNDTSTKAITDTEEEPTVVDYNTLFEQVMSEQNV